MASRKSPRLNDLPDDTEQAIQFELLGTEKVKNVVRNVAQMTSPGTSVMFFILFATFSYIHESYTVHTFIGIAVWILLQILNRVLEEDPKVDFSWWWTLWGLFGDILFYLFIGLVWTYPKLYLDVWLNHLPTSSIDYLVECTKQQIATEKVSCFYGFVEQHRWLFAKWMLTWPLNMAYTFSRDPLRIITDMAFEFSRQRYVIIIESALAAIDPSSSSSPLDDGKRWILFWWVCYVVVYLLIGYLWTHGKLFVDISQGTLPKKLDDDIIQSMHDQNGLSDMLWEKLKGFVTRWWIFWPFSVAHTLLKHPVRIIIETLYKWSRASFTFIIQKAIQFRQH